MKVDKQLNVEIGQRVCQLRKELGFSQTDLAENLEIGQQTVACYENGTRRIPIDLLPALALFLGTSPDFLLVGKNELKRSGPASRLDSQIIRLRELPKDKQKLASDILETFLIS